MGGYGNPQMPYGQPQQQMGGMGMGMPGYGQQQMGFQPPQGAGFGYAPQQNQMMGQPQMGMQPGMGMGQPQMGMGMQPQMGGMGMQPGMGMGMGRPVPPPQAIPMPMGPGMGMTSGVTSIVATAPGQLNLEHDCQRLHIAMCGLGTDEKELIEILARKPREHIRMLDMKYRQMYSHSLEHDIKHDTSFNFKTLLVGLCTPIDEYLADRIYDAVDGVGTKNLELIDVLSQSTPQEMMMLKTAWDRKYRSKEGALESRVGKELSFNFRKLVKKILSVQRMAPGMVDQSRVAMDADILWKAGEHRLGTDDETFIDIFSRSSAAHLQAVSALYAQKHGHPLEKGVRKETSGDYCNLLLALATPRPVWIANRIWDATAGIGTNDSLLIRMVLLNDRPTLALAKAEYSRMYHHDLMHDVKNDTSGDYKHLLIELLC